MPAISSAHHEALSGQMLQDRLGLCARRRNGYAAVAIEVLEREKNGQPRILSHNLGCHDQRRIIIPMPGTVYSSGHHPLAQRALGGWPQHLRSGLALQPSVELLRR